jgi:aspartate/methionine/tyrosine aminotransferase
MWINYPNMPTGASISIKKMIEIITFAKTHNILIINDNPYSFILNNQPLSILNIEGSKQVAMELNSLSKSHNMAGWRVGMLLGSKEYIDQVVKFKSNMDSGMFYGIQKAAITALQLPDDWYKQLNKTYSSRKKIVLKIAKALDLQIADNQQGMFVWGKLPDNQDATIFVEKLLNEKHIFLAPGSIFGSNGDNYVRISLTQPEEVLRKALERINR